MKDIVIPVECLDKNYLFKVKCHDDIPVGWIISESLRLFQMRNEVSKMGFHFQT